MTRAFVKILMAVPLFGLGTIVYANELRSEVLGFEGSFDDVSVILENHTVFRTTQPDSDGTFVFEDLEEGRYFVKVQAPGYRTTAARPIGIPINKEKPVEPFELQRITSDDFIFHWEEDQSASGLEYSAAINQPVRVEFLDEEVEIPDSRAAGYLHSEFNVILSDDEEKWTIDHADRLHRIFADTGAPISYGNRADESISAPISRWTLTKEELINDIEITPHEDGSLDVRVADAAFANASPKVVEIEGRRGLWYSQRLHQAVVRYVTDHGRDYLEVRRIFNNRYGVKVYGINYEEVTRWTTGETHSSFMDFKPEENIALINMLEEMPQGLHRIPQLTTIVRRIDGMDHPRYPTAPAVAWPTSGYIEFMEQAFTTRSALYLHRLILHEKAHFIWAHVLDEQLRDDWIELGQWYEDPEAASGWSTHLTTQFVSAYAHLKNPNEDMAESIADFVVNPDVLRARAPAKYDFIRDRIMDGDYYVSQIREDLTFEVYNLFPDYVYPGKLRRVDVTVSGEPEHDKHVQIEFELHSPDDESLGAAYAFMRIASSVGTYFDMWLYPYDADGQPVDEGIILRGEAYLSQYSKAGYWHATQVITGDHAGNQRFHRNNTFSMKIYLNNPNEDYLKPLYVSETVQLSKRDDVFRQGEVDHELQILNASWEVDEDKGLRHYYPCLSVFSVAESETASLEEWGNSEGDFCFGELRVPHYMRSGIYTLRAIKMVDKGENVGNYDFLSDGPERVPELEVITNNPDKNPPVIDVNRITVDAEPTNIDAPNGETIVEITYYIKDDNSGFLDTGIRLRDPQGGTRFRWHRGPDRTDLYTKLPLNVWHKREFTWILPPGSPPGTWGIIEMSTADRAGNTKDYRFDEVIHIDVLNLNNILLFQ